jgi:L-iditol 2-dehydrogenase
MLHGSGRTVGGKRGIQNGLPIPGKGNAMRVLRLHGVHDVRLHDEPLPVPAAGEALVRVKAVSLCGSDLHWFAEGNIGDVRLQAPIILGHEFAGEIAEGPRRGERVAVDPAIPCGACEYCREGNPNFCRSVRFAGDGHYDGALREYVAWPEDCLHPLPENISFAEGAVLEAMGVGLHAVKLGHLQPGYRVGVYGCGPIGLLIVQLAKLSGAGQIIATDALPHRVQAARQCGAAVALPSEAGRESAAVLEATQGRGVDVAFEVAGVNDAVETAMATAKPGARVLLVGIPADDHTAFTASTARRKGLTILMVRRMKHTYPRAISLVQQGMIDIQSLITRRFPLAEASAAFSEAEQRSGLKTVIEIS